MSYLLAARGVSWQVNRPAAAVHRDVEPLAGVHSEDEFRVPPAGRHLSVDRDDAVARQESRRVGRGTRLDDLDDGRLQLVLGHAHPHGEDSGVQDESEHEVHRGAREQDQRALPALAHGERRLRGRALRQRGLVGAQPHDAHVTAERYRGDAVVGAAPHLPEEPLPEADGEDLDGKTERLGDGEVPELVDDHEDGKDEQKSQGVLNDAQTGAPWIAIEPGLARRGARPLPPPFAAPCCQSLPLPRGSPASEPGRRRKPSRIPLERCRGRKSSRPGRPRRRSRWPR